MKEQETQPIPKATVARIKPHTTVCHRQMTADLDWYPHAQYKGRTIYFCTEFCLDAFKADPDRFYLAHSKIKR
jgi:YHS domain-containing protein